MESETDAEKLKVAFNIAQFAFISQSDQFDLIEKNFEDEIKGLRKQIKVRLKNYLFELHHLIIFFIKDGTGINKLGGTNRDDMKSRELTVENAQLEDKISSMRADINELESKLYNEQTEKDKVIKLYLTFFSANVNILARTKT